jgi:hypothetical protein
MTSPATSQGGASTTGCLAPAALPPGPELRRRAFPGRASELARLRRWLVRLLPAGPARDDVVTIAAELAANAIQHTASGQGGIFIVEILLLDGPPAVRVTVTDDGAPAGPSWPAQPPGLVSNGFGLYMVRCLAARTGVSGGRLGRRVWAEVTWTGQAARWSRPRLARASGTGGMRA